MSGQISGFLGSLFGDSFPDLSCLRCHHDSFFIVSPMTDKERPNDTASQFFTENSVLDALQTYVEVLSDAEMEKAFTSIMSNHWYADLVCKRCGCVERHFLPILMKMQKPVTEPTDEA